MASSSSTLDVPPSSNTAMAITGDIGAEGDVLRSVEDVRGGYEGCNGAGGKLRSSKRASAKKTPYDRPPLGRHARRRGFRPAPFSSGSSITSQIMGSASRLISSSASYLFSSLFTGRKSPAITQGLEKGAEASVGAIEPQPPRKNMAITIAKQDANSSDKEMWEQVDAQALVRKPDELAREEIRVSQIEEIIKRQTWSREQVDRLTKVLQSCVADTSTGTTTTTTVNDILEETQASPISEAQRWRELKKARNDPIPVEIARAYMEERASLASGLASPFGGNAYEQGRLADIQPPPVLELQDRTSPIMKPWVPRLSSLALARMSVGPMWRAQQKPFATWGISSSSLHVRRPTDESLRPQTFMSTPIHASQTAQKILDTLEKLSPSPNEKLGEDGFLSGRRSSELIPAASHFETRKTAPIAEQLQFSKYVENNSPTGMQSPTIRDETEPKGHITSLLSGFTSGKEQLKVERQVNSSGKPPPLWSLSGSFQSHDSFAIRSTASEQLSPPQLLAPKSTPFVENLSWRTPPECSFASSSATSSAVIVQASSGAGFSSLMPEMDVKASFKNNNENITLKGSELGKVYGQDDNGDLETRQPEQGFKAGLAFSVKPSPISMSAANSDLNTTGTSLLASFDAQIVKELVNPFSFGKTTPLSSSSSTQQGLLFSASTKADKDSSPASAVPTFSFTSPSKETKMTTISLGPDVSLSPVPTFSFGSPCIASSPPVINFSIGSSGMASAPALSSLPLGCSTTSISLPIFAFGSSTSNTLPTPSLFSFNAATTLTPLPGSALMSNAIVSPLSIGAPASVGEAPLSVSSALSSSLSFRSSSPAPPASLTSLFSLPSKVSVAASGLTDGQVREVASTSSQIGGDLAGVAEKGGRKFIKAKRRK